MNLDYFLIYGSLVHSLNLKANLVALEVGSKATLVADGGGVESVLCLDEGRQVVVGLAAHAEGLAEAGGANG